MVTKIKEMIVLGIVGLVVYFYVWPNYKTEILKVTGVANYTGNMSKNFIKDCVEKNHKPLSSYFEGQPGFSDVQMKADTEMFCKCAFVQGFEQAMQQQKDNGKIPNVGSMQGMVTDMAKDLVVDQNIDVTPTQCNNLMAKFSEKGITMPKFERAPANQ